MFTEILTLALLFFSVHALMDYPLQGPFLSVEKGKISKLLPSGRTEPGDPMQFYHLFCHAAIQALGVYFVTYFMGAPNIYLAYTELVLHTIIDELKVYGKTTYPIDQALHLLCKAIYIGYIVVLPLYY